MALQVPIADELRQIAKANFFELREDEIVSFQSALKPIFRPWKVLTTKQQHSLQSLEKEQ